VRAAVNAPTNEADVTPVLAMHFRKAGTSLRLFTTIATLGTPQDITLQELRIESFFPVDDATANTATVDNAHGLFSFTKGTDKWVGTFKGKPIERYDEDKVKSLLTTFKALNAEDFADGKSAADTGLDKPEATVTITLKDGRSHTCRCAHSWPQS